MVAVQLKLVDAGDLYASWRWEDRPDEPRVIRVPRDLVREALDDLARAVPSPLPGESADEALARSLTRGPLVDRDREVDLATRLARALVPHRLAAELNSLLERGVRPHLRISPSPSTALVPWEALRVDEAERIVHTTDVSVLPPATVRNAVGRRVSPFRGPVVGVLDPRVPGFGDASGLGSVLGDVGPELRALAAGQVPGGVRRDDVDRDFLERALADAARLLYVGHVTTGGHGLAARLHLSCRADTTTGRAAPVGAHRPLTAADLVLGHRPGPPRPWRMPNRVALVACESGGDVRFAEPSGLVTAMVHGGAEYVLSTRWTLPTDAGLTALVPGFPPTPVLGRAVSAVDRAQSAADPVAALGAWQREQATRWERTGDPACSPVVWAAFATAWAPAPRARNS
ncbi:CHAT domain-containing protein [Saccharothrix australiensis]|uniref:CHAT domain-containing protein n=1 Tax=Saccharothrix australiensis TaxID=2072 RepID=A0A495W7M4_9PSEU|nr:CHAT domain-containing protein [Saccharothrix australiensis]RKT55788.1 CHAT domain-containing protein [Saccharothrix australiensis]